MQLHNYKARRDLKNYLISSFSNFNFVLLGKEESRSQSIYTPVLIPLTITPEGYKRTSRTHLSTI